MIPFCNGATLIWNGILAALCLRNSLPHLSDSFEKELLKP